MILTRDALLAEIAAGNIVIDPYEQKLVGPASIDLRLGGELRVFTPEKEAIDLVDEIDPERWSRVVKIDGCHALGPGETVLGITAERVRLAPNLCGWLEGRSRFARVGLMIHVTAGFLSPGIDNRQVLEISNLSRRNLNLYPGTPICQIVVQRAEGSAIYSGRFAKQLKL